VSVQIVMCVVYVVANMLLLLAWQGTGRDKKGC
jgi:hypothetical protein